MKSYFRNLLVIVWLLLAGVVGCKKHEQEAPKAAEKSAEPEGRVKHGASGETIITIDDETRKTMGLQTAELAAEQMPPVATGYARVLDLSPLGGFINDLQAARIAADAARQEAARIKTLREQNNASEKVSQAAESAAAREEVNLKSILVKIQAQWGKKLADLTATHAPPAGDASKPDPLPAQLFDLQQVLVRVDFPPGAPSLAPNGEVKLFGLGENAPPVTGQFFDIAPTVDPQTQARGIFYLLNNTNKLFAPGMALRAEAATAEPARQGVVVPRDAIVRSEGKSWVYVQVEPGKFTRREVTLAQLAGSGWLVFQNLKPHDQVVVAAAQELLSEELKEQ